MIAFEELVELHLAFQIHYFNALIIYFTILILLCLFCSKYKFIPLKCFNNIFIYLVHIEWVGVWIILLKHCIPIPFNLQKSNRKTFFCFHIYLVRNQNLELSIWMRVFPLLSHFLFLPSSQHNPSVVKSFLEILNTKDFL